MPYDKDAPMAVVQPPAELAHLTGDALFDALTKPEAFQAATGHAPEEWDSARFRAEVGRSEGRFKVWMVNHYKVKRGIDPATIEDRIAPPPDRYEKRSPRWLETTARNWAIEEKVMSRGGAMVPYKPPGRPVGATDGIKRTRKATMRAGALEVLAQAEQMAAAGPITAAEIKTRLAERHGMTTKQIARRLETGRSMRAAGVRPITDDMTPPARAEIITTMYRLLMADGRRKHGENARAEIAERLGCERAEVDAAIDGTSPAPEAEPEAERPRNYEAEQLRAEMEAAILVDNITRGTAPLHPQT